MREEYYFGNSWDEENKEEQTERPSFHRSFKPHLNYLYSLRNLTYHRQAKLTKIKQLVQSGQYETEEKIKITAVRILDFLMGV